MNLDFTDREKAIIRFAVHRLMHDAYSRATAAAQDIDNRFFKPGAATAFFDDARDCEALLAKIDGGNDGTV